MYGVTIQYIDIVCVSGIVNDRTTGGKCVECDSIPFRYIYELIHGLPSMYHDTACLPQF